MNTSPHSYSSDSSYSTDGDSLTTTSWKPTKFPSITQSTSTFMNGVYSQMQIDGTRKNDQMKQYIAE